MSQAERTSPDMESVFRDWYQRYAMMYGLALDPYDPEHFYDWKAAYGAGATPDAMGHWPSEYKLEGHPNLYINGIDTRTGKKRRHAGEGNAE